VTTNSGTDLTHHDGLIEVLDRARRLGFTGGSPSTEHIAHALRFGAAIDAGGVTGTPLVGVDLGSGAGLPGLVLALALPGSRWVLVEAMERRAQPLVEAVDALDLGDRVEVWVGRAEAFGHQASRRGEADVVTARGFGPPAVVAECGAPLLRQGGRLLVSEPPDSVGDRWPAQPLERLGLAPQGVVEGVMVCRATGDCPGEFPRRVGLPGKRPLF